MEPVEVQEEELLAHFIKLRNEQVLNKNSVTVLKLTAPGIGRQYLHPVLWRVAGTFSLADSQAKRMLQCVTNTFPVQARLAKIKKAQHPKCLFCQHPYESLFHWQQQCPQFQEARTRVHHNIWSAVYSVICKRVSTQYECYKEVSVGQTYLSTEEGLRRMRPDSIFWNKTTCQWTLVDFTRSYGRTRADLVKAEETKQVHYQDLMVSLRQTHGSVKFYPLATGYNGSVAKDTWRAFMQRLELGDKAQVEVFHTLVQELCKGFSTMVDVRWGCMVEGRRRHSQGENQNKKLFDD